MHLNPIRIGLIGAGGIGAYHLTAIESFEKSGVMKLVSIAEPSASRFEELRSRLESKGVRWHLDYRRLLEENSLDVVIIATPIPLHYEMTLACLRRGVQVYLEKPPVPLIQQLDELIQEDSHNDVGVGFQMIGSQPVQLTKNAIVRGDLGKVSEIRVCGCWPRLDSYYNRANWSGKMRQGEEPVFDGPATNALAHLIHNIMYLASPAPQSFDVPESIQGELYRARPIESYDIACFRGDFASGIQFSGALTHATEKSHPFSLKVTGDKGWILLSNDGMKIEGSCLPTSNYLESTVDLIEVSYKELIKSFATKECRVSSQLKDTRGYVLSTNGALVSSQKIHDIHPEWVETYHPDGDRGYNVVGLHQAVETTFKTGKLFSEQELPWAVRTRSIDLKNLHSVDFPTFCPSAPRPANLV